MLGDISGNMHFHFCFPYFWSNTRRPYICIRPNTQILGMLFFPVKISSASPQ
uniref:Uncharacterized protein n=1 Tax=Anguilla anguilla TaxID=7936 RepID=A0A0E9RLL0_ANGAN